MTAHEMCKIYPPDSVRWLACIWRIIHGCHGCAHYPEKEKEVAAT